MSKGMEPTAEEIAAASRARMAAFEKHPKEVREALSEAPYGIPAAAVSSVRDVERVSQDLLRKRDVAGVGPAPKHAKRNRIRRTAR